MELRLKIPKTAVSSETCKLIEWYVEVGEQISLEQPLYLIETEKSAIEYELLDKPGQSTGIILTSK